MFQLRSSFAALVVLTLYDDANVNNRDSLKAVNRLSCCQVWLLAD